MHYRYRGHSIEYYPGPNRYADWLVHTYGAWGYYWFQTEAQARAFVDNLYE